MILKLLLIIFLIIGLFYLLFASVEKFSNKNYINTEEIPLEYNKIYSSIPYDIKIKNENSSYYDYGNDELNEKFIKVFNIHQQNLIKMIEGIEWTEWKIINDDQHIINYSNKIMKEFSKKINNDIFKIKNNPDYIIIRNNINRLKSCITNNKIKLLDIDVIIHRPNRPLAKHIKILAVSNNYYVNFLMIKVIGVIKECELTLDLQSSNDIIEYTEFYPDKKILYDMNSFIFDTNDKLVNSEIEYQLYQKLLKELDNK
jgi:hypothetical protein